jgi:hypothetical protein
MPAILKKAHQADADRRDAQIASADKIILKRRTGSTFEKDLQYAKSKMDRQLKPVIKTLVEEPSLRRRKYGPTHEDCKRVGLELNTIGAAPFMMHARDKDTVIGHISVYEINQLIKDKKEPLLENPEAEVQQMLEEKLPAPGWAGATLAHFSKQDSNQLPPHRPGVDHTITLTDTLDKLSTSPLYSMSLEQLEVLRNYVEDHLHRGFITHSNTSYASPVLFAKKPGGGWRFCVDYRKLNAITKKDVYPIPLIQETLTRIAQAKVFTKLDIRQAFYRIRLSEDIEDLTTFRTRYGNFKYRVLPFGLCNGPATFQRYINTILSNLLDDFCTAYMDDILIYSDNLLQHETHVAQVLQRLKEAGLQVDIKKSEFAVKRTKFLGLIISTEGIQKDPEKIEVIRNWEVPISLKGL